MDVTNTEPKHIIQCAACGSQLASRPGWTLKHHGDGTHSAVFWGRSQQPPPSAQLASPSPNEARL